MLSNSKQALAIILFLQHGLIAGEETAAPLTSEYTSLSEKHCKPQNSGDESSYLGLCPGIAGYKLELIEGDLRQTINVIAPDGKKSELALWNKVSSGFSAAGDKVEWRLEKTGKKKTPRALIVRFNASENPDDSTKLTSYLVVVKITAQETCITHVVKPKKKQNEEARELSNKAAGQACYQRPE